MPGVNAPVSATDLPPVVVDRSAELARCKPLAPGKHKLAAEGAVRNLVAHSKRGDGSACLLANLIWQAFPDAREVHVEGEKPYLIRANGRRIDIRLDPYLVEVVGKFDRGEELPEDMIISLYR